MERRSLAKWEKTQKNLVTNGQQESRRDGRWLRFEPWVAKKVVRPSTEVEELSKGQGMGIRA